MYMLSNTEHHLILNIIFCLKMLPGKVEASSNCATTSGAFSFLGQLMIWFAVLKLAVDQEPEKHIHEQ